MSPAKCQVGFTGASGKAVGLRPVRAASALQLDTSAASLAIDVASELRRLTTEIDGLDEHAAQRFGINRTDMRCLDVLTSRGPMRPSELAAAVRLSSGGLSIALERLERAGYVTRRPHDSDRRSVLVEATEKAHQVDEEIFGGIEAGTRGHSRNHG